MAKILLIDDEEIIRRRLKNILTVDGYEVSVAENGEVGLEVFKKENPEIVVVDIKMPGMDGIEVLKQAKELSPQTEVIIITGHGVTESAVQALRLGAYDYISKPINIDELEIAINRALEKQIILLENKKMHEETQRQNEVMQHNVIQIAKLHALDTKNVAELKVANSQVNIAKKEIEKWSNELEIRVKEKTKELVRSQEQVVQSAKMSALGHMASGLTHELNSPLAALIPLIASYKNKAEEGTTEHMELRLMLNACEHMAKVIIDFASFSRKSKGKFNKLNLNEVIEDTLSFSAERLKQKSIKIIKEYENTPPKV